MATEILKDPEGYALRHTGNSFVKMKYPGALWAKKFPAAHFRVWPRQTIDYDNYTRGADVSILPCFGPNHYTLGSLLVATVTAENGVDHLRLESGLHVPSLPTAVEGGQLADEQTELLVKTAAVQAIAAWSALQEVR